MALKTFAQLQEDLVTALAAAGASIKDTRAIAVAGALVNGLAASIAQGYNDLAVYRSATYVHLCRGSKLDRRIAETGMIRGQGSLSTGSVIAYLPSGQAATLVPAGTMLQAPSGVLVTTTETVTVSSPYSVIDVSAVEVGFGGDLAAGTVLTSPLGLFSVLTFRVGSSVVSDDPTGHMSGGGPRETDTEVIARYPLWIKGLAKTTYDAVKAVLTQTSGVSNLVVENARPTAGWITISIAANGQIPTGTRNAIDAALVANGPCSMGYVLKSLQSRNVPVTLTVYSNDQSQSPGAIRQAVTDAIAALTVEPLAGDSVYLDAIRVAAQNAGVGVKTTVIETPTTDVIALASDIIILTPITVAVEYLS